MFYACNDHYLGVSRELFENEQRYMPLKMTSKEHPLYSQLLALANNTPPICGLGFLASPALSQLPGIEL